MVELKHETDPFVAETVQLAGSDTVEVATVELDDAFIGPVQAAQDVQERALAAAGGPDDGDELAFVHGQIHALEDVDPRRAHPVGLMDVLGSQNYRQ